MTFLKVTSCFFRAPYKYSYLLTYMEIFLWIEFNCILTGFQRAGNSKYFATTVSEYKSESVDLR